jgi:hypothetical protein
MTSRVWGGNENQHLTGAKRNPAFDRSVDGTFFSDDASPNNNVWILFAIVVVILRLPKINKRLDEREKKLLPRKPFIADRSMTPKKNFATTSI